jgi:hypothetical protein
MTLKYSKKALKESLLKNLSMVIRDGKYSWVEFEELPQLYEAGWVLANEQKRELYERMFQKT